MSRLGLQPQQGFGASTSVLFTHHFPLILRINLVVLRGKDMVRTKVLERNVVPGSTKLC